MKITLIPQTRLGNWSVVLLGASVLLFLFSLLLVALGQQGGDTFFSNLLLTIPMLLAGISGVAAFATGFIGMIRDKERSIFVFFITVIGFIIVVFGLGEILFPH